MRGLAVLTAMLGLVAACAGGSQISGERRNVGSVTVTLRIEPSAPRVGQPVRLALRLVNNAGTSERLTFPSGKRYDFWVTDGSEEVWRWSAGQAFVQIVTSEELAGQTSTLYDETWTPEQAGSYVVHASLEAERYDGELTGTVEVS